MTIFSSRLHRNSLVCLLSAALLATGLAAQVMADPQGPRKVDHQIALAVTAELRAKHLTQHPLDTEMSQRCLKQFLRELDPQKLYFYQSDIDEFMKSQDSLAQWIANGDIGFAYKVYRTFLARLDERVKTADELLGRAAGLHRRRGNARRQGRAGLCQDARPRPLIAGGSESSTTCWC